MAPVEGRPSQLVLLADGRLVVALRDASKLAVLEVEAIDRPLARRCTVPTPTEPVGLALTPNDDASLRGMRIPATVAAAPETMCWSIICPGSIR